MAHTRNPADPKTVYVWDRFVRFFHWTLVASFAIAFLTEDDLMTLHVWAGYLAGALILLRLPWGLVGPRHARFSDFAYRPGTALAYARDLLAFRARRYLGHSPAGGMMVFALLVAVSATVLTGIAADDRPGTDQQAAAAILLPSIAQAGSDDRDDNEHGGEGDNGGGLIGEAHEAVANLALLLVLAHVAGVAWASLVHRENLARAMVTGRKRAE